MTREQIDREIKECQHEFVTLNAVHEPSTESWSTVRSKEVWAIYKRAT
jgi:hypothetical protein